MESEIHILISVFLVDHLSFELKYPISFVLLKDISFSHSFSCNDDNELFMFQSFIRFQRSTIPVNI